MKKLILRLVSIYLWWFTIVFILAITASSASWLSAGSPIGDILIRRPYQWDFELMFTVLFLVWGIFLWRASTNIKRDLSLIHFSGWAFITHALVFIAIGLFNNEVFWHTLLDSLWWWAAGLLLLWIVKSTSIVEADD